MNKRRKTMTYFLKEDYEIYDSLPCSAVVFSVDDNYKIYYTNDTYNNGNFNQDNIIVEEDLIIQSEVPTLPSDCISKAKT